MIKQRMKQLSSRLSSARSQALQSDLTAFSHESDDLMLQSFKPWQTADVSAQRVNPCLFSSVALVRSPHFCDAAGLLSPTSVRTRAHNYDLQIAVYAIHQLPDGFAFSPRRRGSGQQGATLKAIHEMYVLVQSEGDQLGGCDRLVAEARSPAAEDPAKPAQGAGRMQATRLLQEQIRTRSHGGGRLLPDSLHWTYPSGARQCTPQWSLAIPGAWETQRASRRTAS